MSSDSSNSRKFGARTARLLALLGITVLALAASPAALAEDRGGPGAPSVQQSSFHTFSFLTRVSLPRLVSWSD